MPASLTTVPYSQTGICVSDDYSQRKYTASQYMQKTCSSLDYKISRSQKATVAKKTQSTK
jgi:hypothetical protein